MKPKPKEPYKVTTIRIPQSLYRKIEAEAQATNKSINNVYNTAVKSYFTVSSIDQFFSLLLNIKSSIDGIRLSQKIQSEFFIQYVSHYFTNTPDASALEPEERKEYLKKGDILTKNFIETVTRKLENNKTLLDNNIAFLRSDFQDVITKMNKILFDLKRLCIEGGPESMKLDMLLELTQSLEQKIHDY